MKKTYLLLILCLLTVSQLVLAGPINEKADTSTSCRTNLVIFVRFADDAEITHPFNSIDSMFNGKTPGYASVYNFYNALTYGKLTYNTVYADQIVGNSIVSFADVHPRGYYQPYSSTNPIGYQDPIPLAGICMREIKLLEAAINYVDSLGLVDSSVNLDGDDDGMIDNISFIIKGDVGNWVDLLWPHMEFFPHDSVGYIVTINGKKANAFNFEFEGSSEFFNVNVFRHEMMHSLGIPDLYHYANYTNVHPAYSWDVMGKGGVMNQTNMMFKSQYLHVADEPIQITEDGTYTLYSNATSPTQSSYFIKSAIDSAQWFTFEYRNKEDLFDDGIPGTGLIAGRWNTHVPLNIHANIFFDNDTVPHQYWIFRPGSTSDIVNGNILRAHFSAASGRTSFGPTTDPHPYLSDGTVENSFEITEIQEYGEYLTFHVHFLGTGIENQTLANKVSAYPNPAVNDLTLTGENMQRIEIFNSIGQLVMAETASDPTYCTVSVDKLSAGIHIVRIINSDGTRSTLKFVKK